MLRGGNSASGVVVVVCGEVEEVLGEYSRKYIRFVQPRASSQFLRISHDRRIEATYG